jgi:serine protease Do
MAKRVIDQLIATGHVERGRIGVALDDPEPPAAAATSRALGSRRLARAFPAERADLRKATSS